MVFSYRLNDDTELRLLEPRYAQEIFDLIDTNRSHLQNWLDWVERTHSVDDTKAYCSLALEQCSQGKSLVVGIWHHSRFAGIVGLEDINTFAGTAEIGYWLGEEFEGHSLVTNTCRAIIAHAFGTLGVESPANPCSTPQHAKPGNPTAFGLFVMKAPCVKLGACSICLSTWKCIPAGARSGMMFR